jgi:hypothetical protein
LASLRIGTRPVAREKLNNDRIEMAFDPETDMIRIKSAENGSGVE